jgi:hypothetical protein
MEEAQGNLSPVEEDNNDVDDVASLTGSQVDPDPDGLEFQGAFLSPDNEGVWVAQSDISNELTTQTAQDCYGATLQQSDIDNRVTSKDESNIYFDLPADDFFHSSADIHDLASSTESPGQEYFLDALEYDSPFSANHHV